ncbi:MAG: arginine--tRNA ligase [Candidatus Nomurabacteria bacterium]|nr:MAG: arginine--tRNA ligase [Candidatus Nomurabacteria bacterium]
MLLLSDQIRKRLVKNILTVWPELEGDLPEVLIEPPADARHGDFSSNIAMQLAARLKMAPVDIAQKIIAPGIPLASVGKLDVVPPGFINIYLKTDWLRKQAKRILLSGNHYGHLEVGQGERVHLEFISANPTGPLHLGNGRGGFTGDTLGNVLEMAGYRVYREYYVNDIGKQVDTLAESIIRRYFQEQGIPVPYPDTCYQGEYVKELAKTLDFSGVQIQYIDRAKKKLRGQALRAMMKQIKQTLSKVMRIDFDNFFFESELHTKKLTDRVLRMLEARELLYEKDGALWMRTTAFGDDKDRAIKKSDGEKTYFLSDLAYLFDKFAVRRYPRAILLLGADHHGYVGRMQAAMRALGWEGRLTIHIFQLVRLMEDGKEVRMSKRSGTFVTIDELIKDVGIDAARFFFLMSGMNTHMDFDLNLAREQSDKNPVYYVQYAHARIASILRKADPLVKKGKTTKAALQEPSADELVKQLLRFPELVAQVARRSSVHELPQYAMSLATAFHNFYTKVRVIDNEQVSLPAYELCQASKLVLQKTLALMGIHAPEKMERTEEQAS